MRTLSPRKARRAVRKEAARLAKRNDLDKRRVRRVFERMEEVEWFDPSFPYETALDEAIEVLGPPEALALFEREDLGVLSRRVTVLKYLRDDFTPLHTLDELASLTREAANHLERNRVSLIETGFPRTNFAKSPWHDWHVTKTYFVKLPAAVQAGRSPCDQYEAELLDEAERDSHGDLLYKYEWAREPVLAQELAEADMHFKEGTFASLPGYRWGDDGVPRDKDDNPVTLVAYTDAALLPGVVPAKARRLEGLREKVVQLKIDVLECLAEGLEKRNTGRLWRDCLDLVTRALLGEEADFLLSWDRCYRENYLAAHAFPTDFLGSSVHHSGGLSDLLSVVGHVEKELTIGAMDKTATRFSHVTVDLEGTEEITVGPSSTVLLWSYYQCVGEPWQEALNEALDGVLKLEEEENAFWEGFNRRVNTAFEEEFCDEIFGERVQRKHIPQYEPYVRNFASFVKWHLELTGKVPELGISALVADDLTTEPNTFRKEGDYWTLSYEDLTTRVKDTKGMHYIEHLLVHPNQPFTPLYLMRIVGGKWADSLMSEEEALDEGLTIKGSTPPLGLLDECAKVEYRDKLKDMREELAEAQARRDIYLAETLQEKIDVIERTLSAASGFGGRPRAAKSPDERARKAVTKAIRSVIRRLKETHPPIGRHLAHSIQTGTTCCYIAPDRRRWSV